MRSDIKVMQLFLDSMVGIEKFSYPARQEGSKRPDGEFAHIRLIEEYQVGIPTAVVHVQDDDTTTYRTISPVKLRYRIGVVDTSGLAASKIMHGWTSIAMKQLMIRTGVGFVSCKPLSSEDALLEQEWELRQGFSVEVYSTRVYDEVVDNIKTMEISSEFIQDNLDSYLLNFELNE
jgi:hypothetical protein